ncbi:PREDICTED: uncharacterized protein LOC109124900 [Camelina sativa]|uniref:Uncharacterized protein LOC109124900 n=1 Tax=Camelina sativa TaxID=90675 RepID=A0ABM0TES1_CAMSA|nr:PREDICTED: uncharacterized protein LOC109124900 [Camelina sativa]
MDFAPNSGNLKQETIELEIVQNVEEVQAVQITEQKKKVHHRFDLNKTFYYEDGGEFHPGDGEFHPEDGVVQEMKKEEKVQHEFDLNDTRICYGHGQLHPYKKREQVVVDMLKLLMPNSFG